MQQWNKQVCEKAIDKFCIPSGSSLPFSPTYFFRLCFGAQLNHWMSGHCWALHISFIIKDHVASWEELLSYRQLHRLGQLLAPQAWNWGHKETLGSSGYRSRTVDCIHKSTTGLDCFLKESVRHMFLLGFEWLGETLKVHWMRRLHVNSDSCKRESWAQRTKQGEREGRSELNKWRTN